MLRYIVQWLTSPHSVDGMSGWDTLDSTEVHKEPKSSGMDLSHCVENIEVSITISHSYSSLLRMDRFLIKIIHWIFQS